MGRRRRILIGLGAAAGVLAALVGAAWWYTFVEGAPQLDAAAIPASRDLRFLMESFESAAMGGRRSYGVILPPGYEREPERRYPVIMLLHGGHDDGRAFFDKYAITETLDRLYRRRELAPSVIITPDGSDARGSSPLFDPDYFDGPHGRVGTLIGKELVAEVKRRYRVRPEPGQWALGGFSSGGWGALNIGLRHTDAFHTLFSHDGYFVDASGPTNSPEQFVGSLPKQNLKPLRIYLDVGSSDPTFLRSTRQFHATLDRLGIRNTLHVFPGGHGLSGPDVGWNYIRKHLNDSLRFVGRSFAANDGKAAPGGRP
ncbi:MAG: esterase [Cyanobium sp. CACIAM 14]|nr:MAG: esterase [Cyanobium sp. CACIAM 14]